MLNTPVHVHDYSYPCTTPFGPSGVFSNLLHIGFRHFLLSLLLDTLYQYCEWSCVIYEAC